LSKIKSTQNVPDRRKAFETGFDDYDTKPVDFARLSEKISNLLARRSCHEIQA
jgi:DNA-binding response OmpR family regulator